MTNIHFIVNPISGTGKHNFSKLFFQDYFDGSKYSLSVKISEYKGHAIDLSNESIKQNADIIVACGGDGTINEVASTLVGENTPLGIIPVGSGNGLASNLTIPKDINKAIDLIKNNNQISIDVGVFNSRYFFSNTGFGFDADVIKNYEASKQRTLYSYIISAFKSLMNFHKKEDILIEINEKEKLINPFLVFVSNSNELGNNVSLTPNALLEDGLLDIVIVPKLSIPKTLLFGLYVIIKKPKLFKEAKCYQAKSINLARKKGNFFESQIDGEFIKIKKTSVAISVNSKSLIVIK